MDHHSPPVDSLPPLGELFKGEEAVCTAYARLLVLENTPRLPIAVLGQMLIQAPSSQGRAYVAKGINHCTSNQMVFDLGEFYLGLFIEYFRSISRVSHTPPIDRLSSFTFTGQKEADLSVSVTNHLEAKKQALVRDNFRCMLSGVIDSYSIPLYPRLLDEVTNVPTAAVEYTECYQILPEYVSHSLTQQSSLPGTGSIAHLFGGILDNELNGSGVHHLRNVMTLSVSVRRSFDDLDLWLEPMEGTENEYHIKRRHFYIRRDLPQSIVFSSTSTDLPLPDPRYLALHAACARVMTITGAAEYIARILRDDEEMEILSEDECSGQVLGDLLTKDSIVAS